MPPPPFTSFTLTSSYLVFISSHKSLNLFFLAYPPLRLFKDSFLMDTPVHPPYGFQAPPIIKTSPSSQTNNFPILATAIIGILATAFLLVSYYIFVIKCGLNWHRIDFLRPFFIPRSQHHQDPFVIYASATENRGLDYSTIRTIPIVQFKKVDQEKAFFECAVCLNKFQENEKLRVLPTCTHAFHIDCIDVWLQTNANCPLCRSNILTTTQFPIDQIMAPRSSPQDSTPFSDAVIGGDDNFVVSDIRNGDSSQDRANTGELSSNQSISPPRKLVPKKLYRKFHHVSSMGDECINVRAKDDQFSVQPIRRSISMDSSADRQLYLSVQEILQHNRQFNETSTSEGCSSSSSSSTSSTSRIRSIFSFRGSRNAVLPVQLEQQS